MTNGGGMHTQQGATLTTKDKVEPKGTVRPAPEPPKDETKKGDAKTDSAET